MAAARLRDLPRRCVGGTEVAGATAFRSRLLGLSGLSREPAGAGLPIPPRASVHTFGMRFELDLVFFVSCERPLATLRGVPPRRLAWRRGGAALLEIPPPCGGGG